MSTMLHSPAASFVDGKYLIRAAVVGRSAGVAAVHEETHGIVRRSTLYGALLTKARTAVTENRVADIVEQGLLSRGRTSEEVLATFVSITQARWSGYGNVEDIELGSLPDYRYYYDVGGELTQGMDVHAAKAALLEGIVRFCWSSHHLLDCLEADSPWSMLPMLPALAYPDQRLSLLRRNWSGEWVAAEREALEARYPYFAALRGKSFAEMFDPTLGLPTSPGRIMLDPEQQIGQLRLQRARTYSQMSELAVAMLADRLVERYAGTPMAGVRTTEVMDRLTLAAPAPSAAEPVGLNLIEVAENLPRRRKVLLQESVEWDRRDELPIVGVRSWRSFTANFEIDHGSTRPYAVGDDDVTIYAIPHWLGPANRPAPVDDTAVPVAVHPGFDSGDSPSFGTWMPVPVIVAAWTSIVVADPQAWLVNLHVLAQGDYKAWLVVDTEPQVLVRLLRKQLGEVNGFFHAPHGDRRHLGGLVVRCLEGTGAALRGIIFPGRDHTLQGIVTMLRSELADDFRGFGMSIDLHEDSRRKRNEGTALVDWLIDYEHTFSYSRQGGRS